jgi:hypothetical protein
MGSSIRWHDVRSGARMNTDNGKLDQALLDAARELGHVYTPQDLTDRDVRRVRYVPKELLGEVLQKAVQKAIEARAEHERGFSDLVGGVQVGLLGLLRGANAFETARQSVHDQRVALAADIAEIARVRRPGTLDPRDVALDRLERRVHKLLEALEQSERALAHALHSRAIDDGVASIYRVVQGLSGDEAHLEQKRAMMSEIFSANIELKARLGVRAAG